MAKQKQMVCANPNCGYRGPAAHKPKGSRLMFYFLCCFFLLPGLIYGMLNAGTKWYCPECGTVVDLA